MIFLLPERAYFVHFIVLQTIICQKKSWVQAGLMALIMALFPLLLGLSG